jgi:hypothetical protein
MPRTSPRSLHAIDTTLVVQRELFEKMIIDLEKMRNRESAEREYVPVSATCWYCDPVAVLLLLRRI